MSPRPEPTVVSQTCTKVDIFASPRGANPAVLAGSHLSPSPDTPDLWLQSRSLLLNKRHGNLTAWGWERAGGAAAERRLRGRRHFQPEPGGNANGGDRLQKAPLTSSALPLNLPPPPPVFAHHTENLFQLAAEVGDGGGVGHNYQWLRL